MITFLGEQCETGPWEGGDHASFQPCTDGRAIGFRCVVNGVVSYLMLNPSSDGASPDVFLYRTDPVNGREADSNFCPISEGNAVSYTSPPGVGQTPIENLASVKARRE